MTSVKVQLQGNEGTLGNLHVHKHRCVSVCLCGVKLAVLCLPLIAVIVENREWAPLMYMSSNSQQAPHWSDLQKYPQLSPVETTEQCRWRALCISRARIWVKKDFHAIMMMYHVTHCNLAAHLNISDADVFVVLTSLHQRTQYKQSLSPSSSAVTVSGWSASMILLTDTEGSEGITSLFLPPDKFFSYYLPSDLRLDRFFTGKGDQNVTLWRFPGRSWFCLIADGWQFLPSLTPSMGPQRDLRAPERPHMEVERGGGLTVIDLCHPFQVVLPSMDNSPIWPPAKDLYRLHAVQFWDVTDKKHVKM